MYDVPVSFSIYMKQVTQLIDVPIGVAEKSPGLDLLKKVNGSVVINLAVNSKPMLFFGKCPGRYYLKTLALSSAAGSHFHYSDILMSAMVSNHWRLKCLPNRLFRHRSKKTSKFSITGVCEGNSPMTGEFPAQRASNAENVSIWWCRMFFVQWISLKECL